MDLVSKVEKKYQENKEEIFGIGYTVCVHFKIIEGSTERIQKYEGVVINKRGSGLRRTFTVRKISFGIGVERIFPLHSPKIERIEVVKKGKVRRAKLYYMRNRIGKAAMKVKEAPKSKAQ